MERGKIGFYEFRAGYGPSDGVGPELRLQMAQ